MLEAVEWSDAQDARLRRLRCEGATWGAIAAELGRTRWTVIERGRRIGAPAAPQPPRTEPSSSDERLALPAGHPRSWRAITDRTLLHGEPYPLPVFFADLSL